MKFTGLCCALVVAGVTTSSHAATETVDEYASIRTVAVVSTVGNDLVLTTRGLTVFGNSRETVPIPSWGIDDWLATAITQAISKRFEVRQVAVDKAALAKCDGRDNCADALPRTTAVDAYVAVYSSYIPDPSGSAMNMPGIGLFFSDVPFSNYICFVHAAYQIAVVDARTGNIIDHGSAKLSGRDFLGFHYSPLVQLPGTKWPNKWDEFSDEQKAMIKGTVLDLVTTSLSGALSSANLPSEVSTAPAGTGTN